MKSISIGLFAFPRLTHGTIHLSKARFGPPNKGLLERYFNWRARARTRRELMRLTDYQLRDIGLSRYDAEQEWSKSFWQE